MILAANFKMNHTRKTTHAYLETLAQFLSQNPTRHELFLFPPLSALDSYGRLNPIHVGAQNAYPAKNGAFTGEIGEEQLEEFQIRTLLLGHSERRQKLGESQALCAKKFAYYAALNYTIIYCIGESLETRKRGFDATLSYNLAQLEGIDLSYPKLIIAYEPIWAIGTGVSATLEEIDHTHTHLKKSFSAPLLYGGSVNQENLKGILELPCVDGALIGGAALRAEDFCHLIAIAEKIIK